MNSILLAKGYWNTKPCRVTKFSSCSTAVRSIGQIRMTILPTAPVRRCPLAAQRVKRTGPRAGSNRNRSRKVDAKLSAWRF